MKKVISLLLAVMMVMSMVAISGIVSASAESASSGKILNIISPYGEKNAEDIKLAAVSSKVSASVIDVSEDGIPVEQAYFAETTATKIAKDGMIIDVGEIDFGSVMTEFLAGTVYVDMYVYIEDPSTFGTPIFRMFERYSNQNTATAVFDNYLEWNLCNSGVAASTLVAGWNHLTYAIKPTTSANSYIDSAMAEFTAQQKLRYVAFYDHKAEVASNYAIGAVRLLTNQADKDLPWDLEVSPKDSHVTVGEDLTAADLGVTLNGAAVDAAVTGFDSNTAGKQTVTVTYGDYSVKTQINVQAKGFATFQSQSDGLSLSSAGYNVDNFKTGSASVQYASTATPLAQKVFSTPLDFSGLDYIEINMYLTQSAVDNAGSGYWINFEFGSNGNCSNKCVRWRYQGSSSTVAPSKTLKAGWNKVQIPVAALSLDYVLSGTATSNNVPVNGIQWCMAGHDTGTNTSHWVDWSAVNWIRVYMQGMTSGSVILVSGIGYGMDTQLNGEYNGDDLAATIADAKDGDTVTIQDNITLDSPVVIDKDITLNLNRYNISGDLSYLFYVNGGSLNIVDNNTYLNISMGGKQTVFGKLVNGKELGAIVRVMGSADPEAVDYSTLSVAKGITLKAVYGVQVLGPKNAAGNEMYAYGVKA
ncbi:MAG: bacterial Ig-like domain-containing protein, partial [Acutalibacteraceae bacterium]